MSKAPTDADRLKQFLEEEVSQRFYADLLIERAQAAADGRLQTNASGNAYSVTFGLYKVVIAHHYLGDWPALQLAPRDFIAALTSWRDRLET